MFPINLSKYDVQFNYKADSIDIKQAANRGTEHSTRSNIWENSFNLMDLKNST